MVRHGGSGQEVLLVHRPHYDDWSLPKGKVKRRETDEDGARREVTEETGVHGRLVAELGAVHYRDRNRDRKVARFWLVKVVDEGLAGEVGSEVDQMRWLPVDEAVHALTRTAEAELLQATLRDGELIVPEDPVHVYSADYESADPEDVRVDDDHRRARR